MSTLLRKEIRCILPTWLAAIVAVVGASAASRMGGPRFLLNPLYGVMAILLAASSFGSEFQYQTMSLLISQPLDRTRLWKSKMMVLLPALATFTAVAAALIPYPPGDYLVKLTIHLAAATLALGIVPWLTLVYADGLTGAVMGFVVIAVNETVAKGLFDAHPECFCWWTAISSVLLGVMGCRLGYAKFLAWELIIARPARFVRVKAALARLSAMTQPLRLRRFALCVLWLKELRVQAMSFAYVAVFCAGFGLVALLTRVLPGHLAWLKNLVRVYCVTFPVLVGALSVARERNLGLLEWQLSLPASAIRQWSIKVSVCLLLGIGGGFLLPWALLRSRGALPPWFSVGDYFVLSLLGTIITACASAMQRGTLKAAIIGVAAVFAVIFGSDVLRHLLVVTGIYRLEIHTVADRFILLGLMVIATAGLLWLAFQNFRRTVAARGRIASAIGMAIFIVVFLASGLLSAARTDRYHYTVPEKTNDGWETAHLSRESVEVGLIQELFGRIKHGAYENIHGVLLVKNGKLVAEEYFPGEGWDGKHRAFDRDTLHTLQSATKSVNSILIGIAIDRHLIADVEERVSSLCPEYAGLFADEMKADIRLRQLLSMTAGLAWNEDTFPYTDPRNDNRLMNQSDDPVRFVVERPMAASPGSHFSYNSGCAMVLGDVVRAVSGLQADRFAEANLFGLLGISDYTWAKLPHGAVHTGGGLSLRPRDMAKIGLLMLRGGRWQGKQIVSESWIKESTRRQAPDQDYGYQWWLHTFHVRNRAVGSYRADGYGGQYIFVFPDLDLVAVFTGWSLGDGEGQAMDMLQRYILPAIVR